MAKSFNIVGQLTLRGPANVNQVANDITRRLKGITASVRIQIDRGTASRLKGTEAQLTRISAALSTVTSNANSAAAALRGMATAINTANTAVNGLNSNIGGAGSSLKNVTQQAQVATDSMKEFGAQSALAVRRFLAFSIPAGGVVAFISTLKQGTQAAIDFERELVKIAQVTGRTTLRSLRGLTDEITRLSTSLGTSSQDLLEVSRILTQTGLSARDTTIALEALAKSALAPTFTDIKATAEGAIAAMAQFRLGAQDLEATLGSINAVAGKFAVESDDIIFALRRAGGAFSAAGGELEELIGLFTAVRSTTRESAESIATGFRTIFTRIQRQSTIEFLDRLGIKLRDVNNQFVGPFEAIKRISRGLATVPSTDPLFSEVIEELGGFRQVSKVIPLVQQLGKATEAYNVALQGQGSLTKDATTAQQSLSIQIAKVNEEFLSLVRELTDTSSFKAIVGVLLNLARAFIRVGESFKEVLPLITTFGAFKLSSAAFRFGSGFLPALTRRNQGGPIQKFNSGGVVPGVGNTDTVPAMLTPGEFVIRKKAAAAIGFDKLAGLNSLNTGGLPTGDVLKEFRLTGPKYAKDSSGNPLGLKDAVTSGLRLGKSEKQIRSGLARFYGADAVAAQFGTVGSATAVAQRKAANTVQVASLKSNRVGGLFLQVGEGGRSNINIPANSALKKKPGFENVERIQGNVYTGLLQSRPAADLRKEIEPNISRAIANAASNTMQALQIPPLSINEKQAAKDATKKIDLASIEGFIFEGFISALSGAKLSDVGANFDFINPGGTTKKRLAKIFGPDPVQGKLFDAKRTFSADSINGQTNSLATKTRNAVIEGALGRGDFDFTQASIRQTAQRRNAGGPLVGSGDTVPALLTPGEFVINKDAARRIGKKNLFDLNNADRFNSGGYVGFQSGGPVPGGVPLPPPTVSRTTLRTLEIALKSLGKNFFDINKVLNLYEFEVETGTKRSAALNKALASVGLTAKELAAAQKAQKNAARQNPLNNTNVPPQLGPGTPFGPPPPPVFGPPAPTAFERARSRFASSFVGRGLGRAGRTVGNAFSQSNIRQTGATALFVGGSALLSNTPSVSDIAEGGPNSVFLGQSGSTAAGLSGAASGLIGGAFVGSAIGGPAGVAVALGAGLSSFDNAVKEFEDRVANNQFNKSVDTASKSLKDFSKGLISVEDLLTSTSGARTGAQARLDLAQRRVSEEQALGNQSLGQSFFQTLKNPGAQIGRLFDTAGSLVGLSSGDSALKSLQEDAKAAQADVEAVFSPIANSQLDIIVDKFNKGLTISDKLVEDTRKNLIAAGRESSEVEARLNAARREQQIQAALAAAAARAAAELNTFKDSLDIATARIKGANQQFASAFVQGTGSLVGGGRFGAFNLQSADFDIQGRRQDRTAFERRANIFGGRGRNSRLIADRAIGLNRIAEQLPAAITNAVNNSRRGSVGRQVGGILGVTPGIDRNLARDVERAIEAIRRREGNKSVRDILNSSGGDLSGFIDSVLNTLGENRSIKQISETSKLIQQTSAEIVKANSAYAQSLRRVNLETENRIVSLTQARSNAQLGFRAQTGENISLRERIAPAGVALQGQQAALGFGGQSSGQIRNAAFGLQSQIQQVSAALGRAQDAENLDEINKQSQLLEQLNNKYQNAIQALQNFATNTQLAAAASQRLQELQANEQNRFGITERFLTGGREDRVRLLQSIGAARQVATQGSFGNLDGQQIQEVISILRSFGGNQIIQGQTGDEVLNKLLGGSTQDLNKAFGVFPNLAQDILETKKAQSLILKVNDEQLKAVKALQAVNQAGLKDVRDGIDQLVQERNAALPRNRGGIIGNGAGPNRDTITTALTSGEFVVNRQATANNRQLLEAINSGQRLQDGGLVAPENLGFIARRRILGIGNRLSDKRAQAYLSRVLRVNSGEAESLLSGNLSNEQYLRRVSGQGIFDLQNKLISLSREKSLDDGFGAFLRSLSSGQIAELNALAQGVSRDDLRRTGVVFGGGASRQIAGAVAAIQRVARAKGQGGIPAGLTGPEAQRRQQAILEQRLARETAKQAAIAKNANRPAVGALPSDNPSIEAFRRRQAEKEARAREASDAIRDRLARRPQPRADLTGPIERRRQRQAAFNATEGLGAPVPNRVFDPENGAEFTTDRIARARAIIAANEEAIKRAEARLKEVDARVAPLKEKVRNFGLNRFNTGGPVPGVGSGDRVPALLEPGEFVINKRAAQNIGFRRLAKMNQMQNGGVAGLPTPSIGFGGPSLDALTAFGQNTIALSESLTNFNISISTFSGTLNRFSEVVSQMPTEITMNATHNHNLNITGGEALEGFIVGVVEQTLARQGSGVVPTNFEGEALLNAGAVQ